MTREISSWDNVRVTRRRELEPPKSSAGTGSKEIRGKKKPSDVFTALTKGSKDRKNEALDVFAAVTTPAKLRHDYSQIVITIPKGHMRVLDSESSIMGLRRGQFLELLFLNSIGQQSIIRMPASPKYVLKPEELQETQKYLWYVRKTVKELFEAHIQRIGLKPSAWTVVALNEWADLVPKMPVRQAPP